MIFANGIWRIERDPGCHVLFDAANPGNVVLNSGAVSLWRNNAISSSESARHAAQGTAVNQPVYNATDADFVGRGSITFGAGQYLVTGTWSGALTQPSTFYAVVKTGAMGPQRTLMDGPSANHYLLYTYGPGQLWQHGGNTINTSNIITSNTVYIFRAVYNGASSALYLNGESSPRASGNVGTGAPNQLWLGCIDDLTYGWNGKITLIAGYLGAHSVAVQLAMANRLALEYGVAI